MYINSTLCAENEYNDAAGVESAQYLSLQRDYRLPETQGPKGSTKISANSSGQFWWKLLLCGLGFISIITTSVSIYLAVENKKCTSTKQLVYNRSWELQAENICYKAKGKGYGVIKLRKDGLLEGIMLEHVSGDLTCRKQVTSLTSLWGCGYPNGGRIMTIVTDDNNDVVFPANIKISKGVKFRMSGINAKTSKILVFMNLAYPSYFKSGQELRIWYTEDLFDDNTKDNNGMHCVKAYAKL